MLPLLLGRAVRAEQRAQLRQQLALDQEGGIHRLHLLQQGQPRVQLRHLRWLAGTVVHPVDTVSRSRGLHRVPGRPGPARRARHHCGQRQQVRGQEAGGRGVVVTTETAARWCGRWMALPADPAPTPTITYSAVNSGTTLCSRLLPFRLRVMFDDGEVRLSAPGSWLTPQNIPPAGAQLGQPQGVRDQRLRGAHGGHLGRVRHLPAVRQPQGDARLQVRLVARRLLAVVNDIWHHVDKMTPVVVRRNHVLADK